MSQSSTSKAPPTDYPEYAVRRATISGYFQPPLPRSTFHDFVNKGKIVSMKGPRGFYLLNASLKRMGLREVPSLPEEAPTRSIEEILRLAFTLIDPVIFPMPPWFVVADELEARDHDHAKHLANMHRPEMEALQSIQEKIAYASGALDAQAEVDAGLVAGF